MKTVLLAALGALAASLFYNVQLHRRAEAAPSAAPEAKIDIDRLNLTDEQVRRIKG